MSRAQVAELPGALPVTNAEAIHYGLMMGMALGSQLAPRSIFRRKNYFYPDSPKAYQISQYDEPLCLGGRLGDVRIHRVHLEEDAAKLVHVGASGRLHASDASIVDFNRGGTPLAEIVTEPDLRDATGRPPSGCGCCARRCARLGVSDVNMEEGSLRCDANISIRPVGQHRAGHQDRAQEHELVPVHRARHPRRGRPPESSSCAGHLVQQETLHFDPRTEAITSLRSKEDAHDYRYFPEPDLTRSGDLQEMLDRARAALPELPLARAERFEREHDLSADSARLLAFRSELGDFFEAAQGRRRGGAPAAGQLGRQRARLAARRRRRSRRVEGRAARAGQAGVHGRREGGHPGRRPPGARQARRRRRRPGRDRRGRRPRRGRRRRRARPDRRAALPPTPTSPRSCAAAT